MAKEVKRPKDRNQLAKLIVDIATGEKTEQGENKPVKAGTDKKK